MDVIYSKHCRCALAGEFANLTDLRWVELESCWDQAIRLGIVQPPALVDHGELIAQGAAAVKALNRMARSS